MIDAKSFFLLQVSTATKQSVYIDDLCRGVSDHASHELHVDIIIFYAFALIRDAAGRISLARSLTRPRAYISVPRNATYVTNVRYSLEESRVRYVKSAVTLRASDARYVIVKRASVDQRACNTRLLSQEGKSVWKRHRNTGAQE